MGRRAVKNVPAAVENGAQDVAGGVAVKEATDAATKAVEDAVKEATDAATKAVEDAAAAVDNAATALGDEVHKLVQSVSDSLGEGYEGDSELSMAGFFRGIPMKAWLLMGLGVAGMAGFIFVRRGSVGPVIGELIAKGRKRLSKRGHPSICTYVKLQPAAFNIEDPLKKRKFCAQDIFDVETKVTSFGNREWEKTHEKATKTAAVLGILKEGGATCIGKAVMGDLGFSLIGTNNWLGTPKNPFSTSRICGGASCGAAVSVGCNVVDFAIGIDTVGDVRVPAACCGVLGFRSSHGAVSLEGTIPVASSCDALGWFARDAGLLRLVGRQLYPHFVMDGRGPKRFYMAHDVFKLSSVSHMRTGDVLARSVQRTCGRHTLHNLNFLDHLEHHVASISKFKKELQRMGVDESKYTALDVLRDSMILFQRHEFKCNHEEWIKKAKPRLPKTVEMQIQKAVFSPNSEALRFIAVQVREEMQKVMNKLLKA
ncbi:hypothetical protein M758_12G150300 [Ceratodon purpureus]|nr:hypothetical protein M758_12G150300 [Ceratodon purpureus]